MIDNYMANQRKTYEMINCRCMIWWNCGYAGKQCKRFECIGSYSYVPACLLPVWMMCWLFVGHEWRPWRGWNVCNINNFVCLTESNNSSVLKSTGTLEEDSFPVCRSVNIVRVSYSGCLLIINWVDVMSNHIMPIPIQRWGEHEHHILTKAIILFL